ncbi:MAG: alanine--tRNA ligase-related protein [Candidatus Absconditabacterales bacterium]
MTMLSNQEVRQQWKLFRETRGHAHAKPVSLVADSENKSVLFTVAGMQPFVPYLVGKPHPLGSRLYNIQKCIRTNDIDDIGDERHLSMFEMMGNWSLGDYFKKEAITRSIEFLIDVLHIDKSKLGATIFAGDEAAGIPRDDESFEVLQALGIQHIKEMSFDEHGESDNFWTPGPVGPCGPCVEFYYDRGESFGPDDWDMGVNDRYTEIRNNVMMSYYQDGSGNGFQPLAQKNVDTGMGFERLNMVLQHTETIFETDVFASARAIIAAHTDTIYSDYLQSYRVIMDHLRAATFLICDGVLPSNEGRGYVLRRLIRRGYFNVTKLRELSTEQYAEFVKSFVTACITEFGPWYDGMAGKADEVCDAIIKECQQFQQTIANGLAELERLIKKGQISGSDTFKLFDSFGLPWDIIKDVLLSRGLSVDKEAFDEQVEQAKQRSRASAAFVKDTQWSKYLEGVPETKFVGYESMLLQQSTILKDFVTDSGQRVLVFDVTPFYATGGGQVGDKGSITLDSGEKLNIRETIKYAGVYLHLVD